MIHIFLLKMENRYYMSDCRWQLSAHILSTQRGLTLRNRRPLGYFARADQSSGGFWGGMGSASEDKKRWVNTIFSFPGLGWVSLCKLSVFAVLPCCSTSLNSTELIFFMRLDRGVYANSLCLLLLLVAQQAAFGLNVFSSFLLRNFPKNLSNVFKLGSFCVAYTLP